MHRLIQEYKCHKSNGVVFCFWNGRVFASCMDSECRRALSLQRSAYYVMARELEEDIFRMHGADSAAEACSPLSRTRVAESLQSYKLSAEDVQSVLSQSQAEFLNDVRRQKQELIEAYQVHHHHHQQQKGGKGQPTGRLHLRKLCKVPWRCVFICVWCVHASLFWGYIFVWMIK
jgi:hypothetical protein